MRQPPVAVSESTPLLFDQDPASSFPLQVVQYIQEFFCYSMYIENFVVSIPFVMNDHCLLIVATFSDRRPDSETIFWNL